MYAFSHTIVGLLSALVAVQASPTGLKKRTILSPLPESAEELHLKFQPLLDFDFDSCYNTAAISPNGKTNQGTHSTHFYSGGCRWRPQLQYSNAYSRHRCNNGICAIMYEYYFEKDQALLGTFVSGHRHDWENVVVFTMDDRVLRVAPSCGGKYDGAKNFDYFLLNDTHPLVVYHKKGIGEHCFRYAKAKDVEQVENHYGEWFRSPLVSWKKWPSPELRHAMINKWPGKIGPKQDQEFGETLFKAGGGTLPDFDPYSEDEEKPKEEEKRAKEEETKPKEKPTKKEKPKETKKPEKEPEKKPETTMVTTTVTATVTPATTTSKKTKATKTPKPTTEPEEVVVVEEGQDSCPEYSLDCLMADVKQKLGAS